MGYESFYDNTAKGRVTQCVTDIDPCTGAPRRRGPFLPRIFKRGDRVALDNNGFSYDPLTHKTVYTIDYFDGIDSAALREGVYGVPVDVLRHATPEEIAKADAPKPRVKGVFWLHVYTDTHLLVVAEERFANSPEMSFGRKALIRLEIDLPEGTGDVTPEFCARAVLP